MKKNSIEAQTAQVDSLTAALFGDIRNLIFEPKSGLAVTVNSTLTLLYWRIGQCIKVEILKGGRAEYGKQIVATLAQ